MKSQSIQSENTPVEKWLVLALFAACLLFFLFQHQAVFLQADDYGYGSFTYQANKEYSSELKTAAVLDYLKGKGSHQEICKKYGIRGRRTLEV